MSRRRRGRWGEKVPPTGGTVADRFVGGHAAAGELQGAGFAGQGTEGTTVGTGNLFAERLGLLFQQGGQGPFGQAGGGGAGELLHGLEVGVQPRTVVAESTSGHNFAPAGGEVVDFVEEFRRKFTACHGLYYLVLAAKVREQFLSPLYDTRLSLAKLLMASSEGLFNLSP